MKIKIALLLLALGIGIFLLRDQVMETGPQTNPNTKGVPENIDSTGGLSESIPMIDFPHLGEARPTDLIDMALSFPESLMQLDGRRVSLVGFMAPFDSLDDMSRCMIVPSYVGCTFCSPPNIRQVVFITQGKEGSSDQSYSFIEEPSHVTGIFRISLPERDHEGKTQGFVYSIENAEVRVHTGKIAERAPSHASPGGHNTSQETTLLPPIAASDLIQEVSVLLGREPIDPIKIESVSASTFRDFIRDQLGSTYPREKRSARAHAFSLLGLLPKGIGWVEVLTGFELGKSVAASVSDGSRVLVLESVPANHPYVRIEMVGAISDALNLQYSSEEDQSKKTGMGKNEDLRRSQEALRRGIRKTITRRYARTLGVSPSLEAPSQIVLEEKPLATGSMLDRWYSLPDFVGPFFVDFLVGPRGSLRSMDAALNRPPLTLMEFIRPLWYQDPSLWQHHPVPVDFANELMKTPPSHTDVLGVGGLIPWLAQTNSSHTARSISSQWAGDRWAVWEFPDGSAALFLETRWQDEKSALKFRDAIPKFPYQWNFPYENGSSIIKILRGSSPAALNRLDPFAQ